MSGGTEADLDWSGMDGAARAESAPVSKGANGAGTATREFLSDEEILGIDAPSPKDGHGGPARDARNAASHRNGGQGSVDVGSTENASREGHAAPQPPAAEAPERASSAPQAQASSAMPPWMAAAAGDPQHGAEAQRLWQEHQAFRASFSSPEEARAIKELFPGGAQEAQTLRQASQAVDQLDAAIYSGDARAQSQVVAELARANPAAFRQLFSEAAKVLAGLGQDLPLNQMDARMGQGLPGSDQPPTLRQNREGWGSQQTSQQTSQRASQQAYQQNSQPGVQQVSDARGENAAFAQNSPGPDDPGYRTQAANPNQPSASLRASQPSQFDPAAYAAFERSTNDTVARDVRGTVGDTLARVLPEGIADGAARRIGDDIFNEIHRTLAADRTLSEQIGEILRGSSREATANGWRFGMAEQQQVASLLAARARQLVPGVARRVIGEWTSSVLGASRSKAARQASAAARVDIAAPGGSLDSMPLRAMSSREIDYASMSDDQILSS